MTSIDLNNVQNVIVTGKSGAGKQPRIDVLAEEFHLEQLSTGDIFRHYLGIFDEYDYDGDLSKFWDEQKNSFVSDQVIADKIGTDNNDVILGLKAKYFVERGLFGPDYIVNELFESTFAEKNYSGQILDGYPRTLNQAKFLLKLVREKDVSVDFMVLVENTDERIIQRTVQRRICPKCGKVYHLTYKPPKNGKCENCGADVIQRSDDKEEKIKSRLQEFKKKALPAIEYLEEQGIPLIKVPGHLEEFTDENVRKSVMQEVQKLTS